MELKFQNATSVTVRIRISIILSSTMLLVINVLVINLSWLHLAKGQAVLSSF